MSGIPTSQGAPPLDILAEPLAGCQYLFGALRAPKDRYARHNEYEIPTTRRIAVQERMYLQPHTGLKFAIEGVPFQVQRTSSISTRTAT